MKTYALLAMSFAVATAAASRADEKSDAMAVLDKAIKAHGGEAELKKLQNNASKIKGTVHIMGQEFPISGDTINQGPDRQRVVIEVEAGGMKFQVTHVFNRDKGWIKINDKVEEMTKDQVTEGQEGAHSAWVGSLTPLKDKEYSVSLVGEEKVMDRPALALLVSRKDRRDIKLFFDKQTHLLVKTEMRVKDDMSGQEMQQEAFLSGYPDTDLKNASKITVKRDGKLFMEAEISDLKTDEKFDDSLFGKP
jgi:outer membrane lipoprotein-sorting protein